MDQDAKLKAFVMAAAATQGLPFTEDDIIPIEFCAMTDMATGEYYNIQYVIFERPSKRSVWKCAVLGCDEYNFSIIVIEDASNLLCNHI